MLSSASSVSAVAAAVVQHSGIAAPTRVTAFLAPASRHTANAGTALSLIRSVGQPVRVSARRQIANAHRLERVADVPDAAPIGPICGQLFESADALYLPRSGRRFEKSRCTSTPTYSA